MITRSPIYNVARSLTSRQYEFIEREFGYSKTSFLDLPDETLVDIYYDLCEIEATALTRKCKKLSIRSMIITRTSGLPVSALRITGGSFGQILLWRALFPAIPRT